MKCSARSWFRLGAIGLAMALGGALFVVFGTPAGGPPLISADRIALVYAMTPGGEDMPTTAPAAISSGWKDLGRCINGHGRFFSKSFDGPPEPLMLLYDRDGIRTGLTGRDAEHWGASIYIASPAEACGLRYSASCGDNCGIGG